MSGKAGSSRYSFPAISCSEESWLSRWSRIRRGERGEEGTQSGKKGEKERVRMAAPIVQAPPRSRFRLVGIEKQ